MAHTYQPVTVADRTYIPVSDITPITGIVEDKFTWVNIVPDYDTWLELHNSGRVRWIDWYFGTAFIDAWISLTTPSATYTSKTRSDRTYTPVTTPSQTYNEVIV
ncbi:unnamed protein product [marine sediment metagenome]|uniref:Uncharacterized protein n=1 Tax=marine sediment metagenome TaxID=412755 RepID=X0ZUR8_9ZZZZ